MTVHHQETKLLASYTGITPASQANREKNTQRKRKHRSSPSWGCSMVIVIFFPGLREKKEASPDENGSTN